MFFVGHFILCNTFIYYAEYRKTLSHWDWMNGCVKWIAPKNLVYKLNYGYDIDSLRQFGTISLHALTTNGNRNRIPIKIFFHIDV